MEISKDFPYEPMFNKVIITLNKIEEDGVQVSDNSLSAIQYVVAVGPMVKGIEPGESVLLDVEKMMVPKRVENENSYEMVKEVNLKLVDYDENVFAIIEDRYVDAKVKVEQIKL